MKLETFFDKFDLFADAPDAVTNMRELVLQLAVQGKLVDQDNGDGDAAQLLNAISSERAARSAHLRTPDEPASADGDEHPFQIPCTWKWTQLGNIAVQIQYGYTASADSSVKDIRMLRITDIQNNRVDWATVPGCQIEQDEAGKYLLSPNDILIARTGGTIGKSFIVPDAPVKAVFASYLIRVTPPRAMAALYLKTFLESPLYWAQLRQMSAGTGQPNVNGQALGRLEIPLPPLAEQQRIVVKVSELMALCDGLEAQHQERDTRHATLARASLARFADAPTTSNLQYLFQPSYAITPTDLRKSILALAVQGKLVPQDPRDEPANSLLSQCTDNELPGGWHRRLLGEVAQFINGDRSKNYPSKSFRVDDGVPFINAGHLSHGDVATIDMDYITLEHFNRLGGGKIERGDVLYCLRGSLGKCAVVKSISRGAIASSLLIIRPSQLIISQFIYLYLISPLGAKMISQYDNGSAQPNLSATNVKKYVVPLPPIAEQRRIVAKVDQLMSLVDELEKQLAASRATAANLLEAIVAELTTPGGPMPALSSKPTPIKVTS